MKPVRGLLVPTRSKSSPASADPIEYCFQEIGAQHDTDADPPKLLEPTSPCWHEEVHRSIKRPIELTLPEAAMPLIHHPNPGRGTREVTRGAHCRKASPRDRPQGSTSLYPGKPPSSTPMHHFPLGPEHEARPEQPPSPTAAPQGTPADATQLGRSKTNSSGEHLPTTTPAITHDHASPYPTASQIPPSTSSPQHYV